MKTCTNINCEERFSKCCHAGSVAVSGEEGTGHYECSKCGNEFIGGECTGGRDHIKCWCKKCGKELETREEYIDQDDTCNRCFNSPVESSSDEKHPTGIKKIPLELRAVLPDGTLFYQRGQYLRSFLRRVYAFWHISHDVQLEGEVEDKLQIYINGEWYQTTPPEFFKGDFKGEK